MVKPTIVVVPAACQPPVLYEPFTNALHSKGFETAVVATPSVGAKPALKDFSEDVNAIRETVTAFIDQGKDIIVAMHSYGGVPGSAALEALGKTDREKEGQKGGVVRLVYVAAQVLREGERIPGAGNMAALRGMEDGLNEEAGTLLIPPPMAEQALFHDLPPAQASHYATLLQPHSIGAMWSPQSYTAWKDMPSTYVISELDRIVPAAKQEEMIKSVQEIQAKAFDVVERGQWGHEPLLGRIEEMVEILERAVKAKAW